MCEDDPIIEATAADPLVMARKTYLLRRLLVSDILRYREALRFCEEIDEVMPVEFRAPFNQSAEPEDERSGWWNLLREAEADFHSSEAALAERLFNCYDFLVPESRRIGPVEVGSPFIERGFRYDGVTYSILHDPVDFEAGVAIIAAVSHARVASLDG
jgi:hypothetical protein